ncbi:hypothetical protein AAG570_013034 [Ranatra chinensis]|uniref:DUF4773 domain-containing protein n=1 Tax=Ranatra chinensis TaxID=642074 RepID=A0ABD0YFM0_9HEMI
MAFRTDSNPAVQTESYEPASFIYTTPRPVSPYSPELSRGIPTTGLTMANMRAEFWLFALAAAVAVCPTEGLESVPMVTTPPELVPRSILSGMFNNMGEIWSEAGEKFTSTINDAQGFIEKIPGVSIVSGPVKQALGFADKLKDMNKCSCSGFNCKCCTTISQKDPENGLCFVIEFVPTAMELRYNLTLYSKSLIGRSLSGQNPPALCAPIPPMPAVTACVKAYNLSVNPDAGVVEGCFSTQVKAVGRTVASVYLYCAEVGRNGILLHPAPAPPEGTGILNLNVASIPFLNNTITIPNLLG